MKIKEVKELLEMFDENEEFEVFVNDRTVPIVTMDFNGRKLMFSDGNRCVTDCKTHMYIAIHNYLKRRNNEKV